MDIGCFSFPCFPLVYSQRHECKMSVSVYWAMHWVTLMEYIYKIIRIMFSRETWEVYPRNFDTQFLITRPALWDFFFSGNIRLVVDDTFPWERFSSLSHYKVWSLIWQISLSTALSEGLLSEAAKKSRHYLETWVPALILRPVKPTLALPHGEIYSSFHWGKYD